MAKHLASNDNRYIRNNIVEAECRTGSLHKALDKCKGFTVTGVSASYTFDDFDPKPVLTVELTKGNHVEYVTISS